MKKLLLIFGFVFTLNNYLQAQCTPDPDLNGTGFTPAFLPFAYTDTPYNQVLSFMAPKDTFVNINGNNFDVIIDSVQLLQILGIPKNFKYECLERCVIPGGGKGCALLSGQADTTQLGGYRISIYLKTYYRLKIASNNPPQSRIDSGNSYTFRIYRTTGLSELLDANAPVAIKAYPNPAQTHVNFELSALPHNSKGVVKIYDLLGRALTEIPFTNNHMQALEVAAYKNGLYKCVIETDTGERYFTQFIKQE